MNGCLKEIQDIITAKATELLENPQELHSLVNEKRRKDIRDVMFLLEKTKVYENPRDVTKKILKDICLNYGLNAPILGDCYDESKPDITAGKQKFSQTIQSLCMQPEIFFKYKKDRREILEQSIIKSKEYKDL